MTPGDFYATPERLPLHLLDQVARTAAMVLLCEHPSIGSPHQAADPPTLAVARLIYAHLLQLGILLRRYDAAVQDALGNHDPMPF